MTALASPEVVVTSDVNIDIATPLGFQYVRQWYDNDYDDVIKWKHFPRYWPFVRGIHRSPVNFPNKGQWRRALMFSLICARINGWVNNGEAGDLRRHRAHYDVTVMILFRIWSWLISSKCRIDASPSLVIIGLHNGLSPVRCQTISLKSHPKEQTWMNQNYQNSSIFIHLQLSSVIYPPFCLLGAAIHHEISSAIRNDVDGPAKTVLNINSHKILVKTCLHLAHIWLVKAGVGEGKMNKSEMT